MGSGPSPNVPEPSGNQGRLRFEQAGVQRTRTSRIFVAVGLAAIGVGWIVWALAEAPA